LKKKRICHFCWLAQPLCFRLGIIYLQLKGRFVNIIVIVLLYHGYFRSTVNTAGCTRNKLIKRGFSTNRGSSSGDFPARYIHSLGLSKCLYI
jgi:hypothetical protein